MGTLKSIFILLIFIAVVAVSAVFGTLYFTYMPMWDMMNYHYPVSSYISDCMQAGILPLWCPYSYLGSPIYSDPSSGFWYPVNMLLWFLFGFNAYVMKAEYALHLIIAGIGMYKLSYTITESKRTSVVLGIIFPFTGFFIGHPSLFSFIYSMAWVPYVLHYYIKGYQSLEARYFIWCGICMALCILAGYIVFPVLTAYVLIGMYCYRLFRYSYNPVRLTSLSAVAAVVCLILCSGYFYSMYESLSEQVRSNAISLHSVSDNPFSPQSLTSFLLPFSTLVNQSFFDTDVSMRNCYIGLMAFPLIVVGLKYGNTRGNVYILIIGGIFLLASFGAYAPVRAWLYHTLPFMDMFRHPAIFRAGTLLCLLLVAAAGLKLLYTSKEPDIKRTLITIFVIESVLIAAIFLVAIQYGNIRLRFPDFSSVQSVIDFNKADNIWSNIIVQCAAQAIMLILIFIALFFYKNRALAVCLSLLWVLDIMVAAQMNIAGTVVCNVQVKKFDAVTKQLPRDFIAPEMIPVNRAIFGGGETLEPLVYNANILRKEVSHEGYNPFVLKSFSMFSRTGLYPFVIQQPIAYFSPGIKSWQQYTTDSLSGALNRLSLYSDIGVQQYTYAIDTGRITITSLLPNAIQLQTFNETGAFLTLLQTYYPGWQVLVDGKEVSVFKTNRAFMTIRVPKGTHTVLYKFEPAYIRYLITGQVLLWTIVIMGLAILFVKKRAN